MSRKVSETNSLPLKVPSIPPDYHRFLRDFYTEAFAGILVNWFRESHTPEEKENTIAYLSQFVMTSLPAVLRQNGK